MKSFLFLFFLFKFIHSFKSVFNKLIFTNNSGKLIDNKNNNPKILLRYSNTLYNNKNISDFYLKIKNDKLQED